MKNSGVELFYDGDDEEEDRVEGEESVTEAMFLLTNGDFDPPAHYSGAKEDERRIERSNSLSISFALRDYPFMFFFGLLTVIVGSFLLGTAFAMRFSSFSSPVDHDGEPSKPITNNPVHERGWSVVVHSIRLDLGVFFTKHYNKDNERRMPSIDPLLLRQKTVGPVDTSESDVGQTVDITRYYEIINYALDTIGVRGVYDDLFDGIEWYVYDDPDHSHGIGNEWYGWFWLVHYTGAVTAEKLLVDGSLLLDGSTGLDERLTDPVSFVREIQRIQKHPGKDPMPFHAMHAFVWHYVASTIPDLETYPATLATEFCGDYLGQLDFKSESAKKSIGTECYHGFGHAVFYVMAMRQLNAGHEYKLDVRTQFRPQGGFQLNDESFCQAYRICGTAPNGTVSTTPRKRCIGGVRHSTKLFARFRKGQDPKEVVTAMEKMCNVTSEVLEGLSW